VIVIAINCTGMVAAFLWFRVAPLSVSAVAPRVHSAVDAVLLARKATVVDVDDIPFGNNQTVNILVLGIDSRKEGLEQHCDAIHMVSVDTEKWTVLVTSVPRGTYAYIPPGNYAENEYYLSNACAFAGLEYGVGQIEHVVGVRADYVVTAGFSQVLGILRAIKLPTTESLQWLRSRQTYKIGDPQRSQNQAVFLKDVVMRLLDDDGIPDLLFHVLFGFVDTEMSEATAKALYDGLLIHSLHDRPNDIVLTMKPHYDVKDIHFDPENASAQIDALLKKLRGRLNRYDLANRTIEDVQNDLEAYLENVLLEKEGTAASVIDQQLWLQVEDNAARESFQFRFVESYATDLDTIDHAAAVQYIADYILEKQTLGSLIWEAQGRALLERLIGK